MAPGLSAPRSLTMMRLLLLLNLPCFLFAMAM
jgi:hypothetical protein